MGIVVRVQSYDRKPMHGPSGAKRRGHNRFYNYLLQVDRDELETAEDVQAVLDAGGRIEGSRLVVGERIFLDEENWVFPIKRRIRVQVLQVQVRKLLNINIRVAEVEEEYV